MRVINRTNEKKRGAALVEYGLLVAGVALVTAAAVSIFGHKVNDMVGTTAGILPSSNAEDNGPIRGGRVIQTTQDANGSIIVDFSADNLTDDAFGEGASDIIDDPTAQ